MYMPTCFQVDNVTGHEYLRRGGRREEREVGGCAHIHHPDTKKGKGRAHSHNSRLLLLLEGLPLKGKDPSEGYKNHIWIVYVAHEQL